VEVRLQEFVARTLDWGEALAKPDHLLNSVRGVVTFLRHYPQRKIRFLGRRARPVLRADNLAAICVPIVHTMWDPQHIASL
jgi:hypothetical protein